MPQCGADCQYAPQNAKHGGVEGGSGGMLDLKEMERIQCGGPNKIGIILNKSRERRRDAIMRSEAAVCAERCVAWRCSRQE